MTKGELRKQRQAEHAARAARKLAALAMPSRRATSTHQKPAQRAGRRFHNVMRDARREYERGLYLDTGYRAWDDNGVN